MSIGLALVAALIMVVLPLSLRRPVILVYLLAVSLPFRMPLYSLAEGVGIRMQDILILLLVLFASLLLLSPNSRWTIPSRSARALKVIIWLLWWCALSFLWGIFRFSGVTSGSLLEFIRLMLVVGGVVAFVRIVRTNEQLFAVIHTWALGTLIAAVISIYHGIEQGVLTIVSLNRLVTLREWTQLKFGSSPLFEDPNTFASYLLLSIFLLWSVSSREERGNVSIASHTGLRFVQGHILLRVASTGAAFGLVLTFSRGAWLGMFAGLASLAVFERRWRSRAVLMMGGLAVVMVLWWPSIGMFLVNPFEESLGGGYRLIVWSAALRATIQNPILGLGLGNFPREFAEQLWNPYPHNLYLKLSSEIGLPGLLLFLWLLLLLLKNAKAELAPANLKVLCAGLVAYLVQGMGGDFFTARHFWLYLGIMLVDLIQGERLGAPTVMAKNILSFIKEEKQINSRN